MATQNEVAWLLDTLINEWPNGSPPDTLALRNRDEPETRYPDPDWATGYDTVVEEAVGLDAWSSIGVSSGARSNEYFGSDPQYEVTTALDVRVEAAYASAPGTMESDTDFNLLVDNAQAAINSVRTYPTVDPTADPVGRVTYMSAQLQDETRLSDGDRDYYRTDFSVVLSGFEDPP